MILERKAAYCGTERKCSKCGEWWPADGEFFTTSQKRKGGITTHCHDCFKKAYHPGHDTRDWTWDDKLFPEVKEIPALWAQHRMPLYRSRYNYA